MTILNLLVSLNIFLFSNVLFALEKKEEWSSFQDLSKLRRQVLDADEDHFEYIYENAAKLFYWLAKMEANEEFKFCKKNCSRSSDGTNFNHIGQAKTNQGTENKHFKDGILKDFHYRTFFFISRIFEN